MGRHILPIEIKQARGTLEKSRAVTDEERMDPADVNPKDVLNQAFGL
jgi:hypothetical protein